MPPPVWPPAGTPPVAPQPQVQQAPPPYVPPQPQPATYAYGGSPARPVPQSNGIGIAGLVLAILGITCVVPVVGSILGVVFGHMGMKAADRGVADGRQIAKAGFIIGWVGIGLAAVAIVIFIAIIVIAAVNGTTHVTTTNSGF